MSFCFLPFKGRLYRVATYPQQDLQLPHLNASELIFVKREGDELPVCSERAN